VAGPKQVADLGLDPLNALLGWACAGVPVTILAVAMRAERVTAKDSGAVLALELAPKEDRSDLTAVKTGGRIGRTRSHFRVRRPWFLGPP